MLLRTKAWHRFHTWRVGELLRVNKTIGQLALENEEFKEELDYFDKKIVQAKVPNSDFSYWVEFGNGVYLSDKGLKENPTVTLNCPQNSMNQILKGNISPFTEFFNGNLKIEGDIQYALVYFDLVKLGLEINKEVGGV